jgi:beta-lactamase class A
MIKGYRFGFIASLAIPLTFGSTPALAQAKPASAVATETGLTRLLKAELARFPSQSGIYVKHLATGEEAAVAADRGYDSASTIKLAIMVLAYRLADAHRLNLDERTEIRPEDYRGGSGVFRYNDPGLRPTWRDVITQMIITSDNSATDMMIRRVGGIDAVNAWLAEAGFKTLRLNHSTLELFRSYFADVDPSYAEASAEDLFALQSELPYFTNSRQAAIAQFKQRARAAGGAYGTPHDKPAQWLGIVSPRELGRLLEGIERGNIASPGACAEMARILREQQSGERKIPHFLTVPVGHKTGETTGVTNDAGIVYARSGPIIIISTNMAMSGLRAEGDDRIGKLAELIVQYFDGAR